MNITLSWDLFVIVFGALIVTYTFIIGKRESVKVILSCYVAIVAVQAFGNLLQRLFELGGPYLGYVGVNALDPVLISTIKLVLFIAIIIMLAVKAGFEVKYAREPNVAVNVLFTLLFGVATAGLLLSTLLTYITGLPLLDAKIATMTSLSPIIQQSMLMQIMILNQDVFFFLPAMILLAAGLVGNS